MKSVEIEVSGPRNEQMYFRPLQRNVRGRFDFHKCQDLDKLLADKWPVPLPGQRLGIDSSGVGYVLEPLHAEEHRALREAIEKLGFKLEPERQEYRVEDENSWAFWIARAVECGIARVTQGTLPKYDRDEAQKNYVIRREPERTDKLAAAIQAQTEVFAKLLERLK